MTTFVKDISPEVLHMLEAALLSPTVLRSRLPQATQEELDYLDERFETAMADPTK